MGFDPVTMGIVGLVGTGFKAVGSLEQGAAASNAASYNAVVARNNAIHATQAGEAEAQNVSLRGASVVGRAKAAYGANNITINAPGRNSATDVIKSAREASDVNAINTENNALVTAYGYNAQASLDRAQASSAMIGGVLGAGGDLAGGVAQYGGAVFGGGGGGGGGGSEPSSTSSPLGQSLQSSAAPSWAGADTVPNVS